MLLNVFHKVSWKFLVNYDVPLNAFNYYIIGQLNGGIDIVQGWVLTFSVINKLRSIDKSLQLFESSLHQVTKWRELWPP